MGFVKKQTIEPVAADERRVARECPDLIAALENPDPVARRWAARDLLACPDGSGALVARLVKEQDISVREVIFTTLTKLGDPVAVAGLAACLRSEDVALRNEAVESLRQLPESWESIMKDLLVDADPDVRIFAVNILESLRHPGVETWLDEVILRDSNVNVCSTALDLLAELGTSQSLSPIELLKARFADEPYIQFAADLSLKRIRES